MFLEVGKCVVKSANKSRGPVPRIDKHEPFSFNASMINHFPTQNTKDAFIFRDVTQAQDETKKKTFKPFRLTDDGKLTFK